MGWGTATLVRMYHGNPIPANYYRALVTSVHPDHVDGDLNVPTPDRIEHLGPTINNYILWVRSNIILDRRMP